MKFLLVLIPWMISCSSVPKEKVTVALESWKGRKATELDKHPYFKNIPLRKFKHPEGIEDWIFRDQTRFQTAAYCDSLGGCIGMPTYNCDIAFSVKEGIILGATESGTCPGPDIMKAK